MSGLAFWVVGIVLGVIGLAALAVAATGASEAAYWGGLAVFGAAVLAEFGLINRWFDRQVTPYRTSAVEAD